MHRLTASLEVTSARVQDRTDRGTHVAHHVTAEGNEHLAALMEEPSSEENIEIRNH